MKLIKKTKDGVRKLALKGAHLSGVALTVLPLGLTSIAGVASADDSVHMNTGDVKFSETSLDSQGKNYVYGSVKGQPLWHRHLKASVDGKTYDAYCQNYDKYSPTGTGKNTGAPTDMEWKVLINGYPYVSASSLGVLNDYEAEMATQIAEWIAAGNFSFNDIDWNNLGNVGALDHAIAADSSSRQRVKGAVQKILDNAKKDTRSTSRPQANLKKVSSKQNADGTTTITFHANVTNGYSANDTKVNVSGVDGAKIEQDGKEISNGGSFDMSKDFTVTVPAAMDAKNLNVKFTGKSNLPGQAALYGSDKSTEQNALVYTKDVDNNVNAQAVVDVPATQGGISITKIDDKSKPVEGAKFDLKNKDGKVVASGTTDKNGKLTFNNLPAGEYTAVETDTNIAHVISAPNTAVVVAAGKTNDYKITNDTVKGDITSVTTADGGQHVIDATSKGQIKDSVTAKNLNKGVTYKIVDKVVKKGTNEVLKDKNGKEITTTSEEFTATKDGDQVTKDLTSNLNLSGMQGQDITTMATIYRVKNGQTYKVAEETNNADGNQSIHVQKPTIKTVSHVKANGQDANQTTNPAKDTEATDTATLTGLVKGQKYTETFEVKNAKGEVVKDANGKPVTVTNAFTAQSDTQTVKAQLPKFDTSNLAGQTLTITSTLKGDNGDVLATHDDLNDKDEQIHITKPKMETQALIDDGSEANPNGHATLKDRISYSGVTPGQQLNFKALATGKDGKPIVVTINGKKYTLQGNINYTPTSSEGTVDVPLMAVNAPDNIDASADKATTADVTKQATASSSKADNKANAKSVQDVNANDSLSKQINDWGTGVSQLADNKKTSAAVSSSVSAANGSSTSANKENGVSQTKTSDWKETTAEGDSKYETIKAITPEEYAADPGKAAKTAGGSDLGNPYSIDIRSLAGRDIGLSETMNSNDSEGSGSWTTEAHHSAHDNTSQSVHVTSPMLHTEALINDGHTDNPTTQAKLADKVHYSDVVAGKPVELSAMMYDKETKKPVVVTENGKSYYLVGRVTFTPESTEGDVTVPLQKVEIGKETNTDELKLTQSGDTTAATNNFNAAAKRVDANKVKVASPVIANDVKNAAANAAKDTAQKENGKNASQVASDATKAANDAVDNAVNTKNNAAITAGVASGLQAAGNKDAATLAANVDANSNKANASEVSSKKNTSSVSKADSSSKATSNKNDVTMNGGATTTTNGSTGTDKDIKNQTVNGNVNTSNEATDSAISGNNTKASAIDVTQLAGKKLVAVEDLTQYNGNGDKSTTAENVINSEANLDNKDQTVEITKPEIHTKADVNGSKDFKFEKGKDGKATVKDVIEYKNVTPGKPIKFTAVEMDKSTGEPAKVNGHYLVGTVTITPKEANGETEVTFHETDEKPADKYVSKQLNSEGVLKSTAKETGENADITGEVQNDTSSKASSSSKAESSSASSSSEAKNNTKEESKDSKVDFSDVDLGKHQYVAYETAENVGEGNNVIGEGKNMDDDNETVNVEKTKTPVKNGSSQSQSQEQHQTQTQSQQGAQNGAANGGATTSPAGSNGGGTTTTTNGSAPAFAQTGGTSKASDNWFMNLLGKIFH